MQLHVFSPYVIGLSPKLLSVMQLNSGDNVCFAVTRDAGGAPRELWIGKSTIFSGEQVMCYELRRNHIRGLSGFSAKQLVYELNLNPGTYNVDCECQYSRQTGIDWYKVHFQYQSKRNWRAVCGCKTRKNIKLDDDD